MSDETEVILDSESPDTNIEAGPLEGGTSDATVAFSFSADEPAWFRCSLDGSPFLDCDSEHGFAGLASGPHRIDVIAVDRAGNADPTPATRSWRVGAGFEFRGFFSPVDNPPVVNVVKAGAAVPVKFSLGGDRGLDIFAAGSPSSLTVDCDTGARSDDIETTATAGANALSYDAAQDMYTYVWKTRAEWRDTCRTLSVRLTDGSEYLAEFRLR